MSECQADPIPEGDPELSWRAGRIGINEWRKYI